MRSKRYVGWALAGGAAVAVSALVSCTTIHISTPFGSTVADPILPTATDQGFLDAALEGVQATEAGAPDGFAARVEVVRAAMEEQAEDRYWAAQQLLSTHPELKDPIARALISTDEGFSSPYVSAKVCGECHPKHFDEWSVSPHAYAQLSPVFNAMHGRIVQLSNGTFGDFCIRCHTPVGMNLNEPAFMPNAKRNLTSREGITCVVCHRVAHDYGKSSGRLPFEEGTIFDPVFGPQGSKILSQIVEEQGLQTTPDGAPNQKVHGDVTQLPAITEAGFCGACHDVTLGDGFRLEEAFSEFKSSPSALRGESCQDCHMSQTPGEAGGYAQGPAAVIGDKTTPDRKLTNHMMAGPDYSIVHPGLFPHLPQNYGNPDRQDLRPFFAELTPGRYKLDPSGTFPVSIPLWLEFDHEAGWGEPAFEDALAEQHAALAERMDEYEDLEFSVEDGDAEPEELLELAREIEAPLQELPDLGSWGSRPQTVAALRARLEESAFESERAQREKARRILSERQFRLLAEYRRQQLAVLRAGYQIQDLQVESADADGIALTVVLKNGTEGHNVPTGFIAERSVFVQVHITDAEGRTAFVSGDLDPNGDPRDSHSRYVHDGRLGSAEPLWRFPEEGFTPGEPVRIDPFLLSLQSQFLVRNNRGSEREQILATNFSPDPLPFLRPPTSSTILTGRPAGARIHRKGIEPGGTRAQRYVVGSSALEGLTPPFSARVRLVSGMVPVNLVDVISEVGFDYGMSPRDVAIGVVNGLSARIPPGPTTITPLGLTDPTGEAEEDDEPVQLTGRSVLWEFEFSPLAVGAQPTQLVPAQSE
ncbi:MAG: multiheme c-type cytochrome [Planctomycetota bacterium]